LVKARKATPAEDYSGKMDVIFEGFPLQVSVSIKSKAQRRSLEKRGIMNIPGGENIPDGVILAMLTNLIGLS
jgi:hypothetical protein